MRYSILLLTVIIMCGCHTKGNKVSLSKGRLITCTIPYAGWPRVSTHLTHANGKEALISFNTQTYKRVDVFALDGGKPVTTIPLNELLMLDPHIDDIVALNSDSFLALGQYHNNVYLFNSMGKVLQQSHISDSVPNGHANWYIELSSNKNDGFMQDDSTLLLHSTYWERKQDTTLTRETSILQWYRTNHALPYFLSVRNVFASQPEIKYALPGFYNRFLPDNGASVEGPHYMATPRNILIYSWYCDSVYVINKNNYEIEKVIKIHSAYSKAGSPISIDSLDVLNDNLQTNGSISGAFYDQYRDLYYVAVRHGIARNTTRAQRRHNLKWSLLVYDKQFNQLEEINIDPKYYPGEILITREGIMLRLDDYEKPNVPTQFQLFYVHQK
jgi:hypothetical protein